MRNSTDPRIPIVIGGAPGPTDILLTEAGLPAPPGAHLFTAASHPVECLCCAARSGVAGALAHLYRARATNKAPFFSRVIVTATAAGEAAVRQALETDMLCRARYRLQG